MPELLRASTRTLALSIHGTETRDDVSPTAAAGAQGWVETRDLSGGPVELTTLGWTGNGVPSQHPRFFENTDYDFYLERLGGDEPVEIHHRDPRVLGRLHSRQRGKVHAGTVNFGSAVGLTTFVIREGSQAAFELTLKVFPSKLDFEDDREAMIEETQRELGAIALQWLGATYGFGAATRGTNTDLEWTLLLSHVIDDLEHGLQEVARHPRRGLTREPSLQPAHRVRRPDNAVRSAIHRAQGERMVGTLANGAPVPRVLPMNAATPTLDTPEHRWLAARVGLLRRRLAHVRSTEAARRARGATEAVATGTVLGELGKLAARVERLSALPPLRSADGPPIPGFNSLQLMTAAGYGQAYRACMTLDLALRIQDGVVQLAEKGMDRLYEYWAFLSIVRGVEAAVGGKADRRHLLGVEGAGLHVRPLEGRQTTVTVRSSRGAKVGISYNPEFDNPQLTLVDQQPDVLITYEQPGWPSQCLVVDAKYRLDSSTSHRKRVGAPGPPPDALNVLYRYRDAILERARDHDAPVMHTVIEAAAVYPYWPDQNDKFRESRLWASLERIGVGAIPLLPKREAWLGEWFSRTLGRGAWSLADRALAHRSAAAAQVQLQRLHELAIVGIVPRKNAPERLAWHRWQRLYFVPRRELQRVRFLKWLALYAPPATGERGRVEWVAPVLAVRSGHRADLRTPWAASHSADEPGLIFDLGEFLPLPRPVENVDGERPPTYRWSTYLALTQARNLSELSIETVHEWRLHQQLVAEGIDFVVGPGDKSRAPGDQDGHGAAVFSVEERAEVRHRPNRGFLIRWRDGREAEALGVDDVVARFRASSGNSGGGQA